MSILFNLSVKLHKLREWILGKRRGRVLTIESSGLKRGQIDVGQKALKVLGLKDPNKLIQSDVIIFLYAVGVNPTDDVLDAKLRHLELHEKETYTFADACHIWHSMLQDLTDEEEILKKAFSFFDKDGSGDISVAELKHTMKELGGLLSEQEIMDFMRDLDVNNDGVIGYQEFLDVLRTQTLGAPVEEENFFSRSATAATSMKRVVQED